jgi:ABC-type antimicrobial peptide transport system permease subunit
LAIPVLRKGSIFVQAFLTIRNSTKAFARNPGLAAVLILTIAIGVGSNASVYGFIQGLTQPVSSASNADRIVSIFSQDRSREPGPLSRDQYQLIDHRVAAFDWIEAAQIQPHDIIIGDHSEIANIAAVMPNFAGVLNLHLGKGAVISHRLWEREFGEATNVTSRPIRIHGVDVSITGVAPPQLEGIYRDLSIDVWMPLQAATLQDADENERDLWVFARLHRAVSARQAEIAANSCCGKTDHVSVVPFTGTPPRIAKGLSRIAWLLTFAVGTLFFVACVNVGSLLLGRAFRRTGETSLRVAVGATRPNLIAELLSDSIVISLAGGVLGLLLAVWSEHVIPNLLFEQDAEQLVFAPSAVHIVIVSLLCISVILICGVIPIFTIAMDHPWAILQRESGWPSKTTQRLQAGMAVGQIAMCSVLVIFAALLIENFHRSLQTAAGNRLGDPVLATVQGPAQPALALDYFSKVEQKATRIPDVSSLAWTAQLPGNQPIWRSFRLQPAISQLRDVELNIDWFTADSLETFDTSPVAGRLFGVDDPRTAAVINEKAAADLFGQESVGVVIEDRMGVPTEIIGIVKGRSTVSSNNQDPTIFYNYTNVPGPSSTPDRIMHAHFLAPAVLPPASVELNVNVVSPAYFKTMGLSLVAGHEPDPGQAPGQVRAGVVNQEAADLYFGGKPLGTGIIDDFGIRTDIIGVVSSPEFGTFQQRAEPTIYFPMGQDTPSRMTLILETSQGNDHLLTDLRRRIESVPGPHLAAVVRRLSTQLAQTGLATLRIATVIVGVSASTSLFLSFFGLLRIQSDAERQHRREVALHVALGAQRWRIVLTVVARGGRFALVGTLIGTIASLVLLRIVAKDTIVSSPPIWVWLIAPTLPTVAVMAAAVLPACRASTTAPLMIMRDDR